MYFCNRLVSYGATNLALFNGSGAPAFTGVPGSAWPWLRGVAATEGVAGAGVGDEATPTATGVGPGDSMGSTGDTGETGRPRGVLGGPFTQISIVGGDVGDRGIARIDTPLRDIKERAQTR